MNIISLPHSIAIAVTAIIWPEFQEWDVLEGSTGPTKASQFVLTEITVYHVSLPLITRCVVL